MVRIHSGTFSVSGSHFLRRAEMVKYWGLVRFGIGSATGGPPTARAAGEELSDEMVSWA